MELTGAQILLECLKREGVDVLFGYPGGAIIDIYDELTRHPEVRHILVRHEQGALHAADGYARATGKVGVALVTSGPGATNAVTGLATAYCDSIPLVLLTGQVPTGLIGCDAFQEVDTVGITRPCSKYNYLVQDVKDLAETIRKAFYLARTGRPGPVVIDLPKDVQLGKTEFVWPEEIYLRSYNPNYKPNHNQLKKAVDEIRQSKQPVILAGGGVILSNGSQAITQMARTMQIPLTCSLMALGCFPATDPLFLGMVGMHGTYAANMAMNHADLIVCVGARFDDRVTGKLSAFAPNARVVHIDIDPTSIRKNVKVDVPVVSDCRLAMEGILDICNTNYAGDNWETPHAAWLETTASWKEKQPLTFAKDSKYIKPQHVVEVLDKLTKDRDTIITTEVGQNQMWAAQFYKFNKPRTLLTSGGLGTMGYGLPAAMGAQAAFPKSLVVDIAGDGSIQMNIQELATIVQNKMPVKVLILNNTYLGMVRQWQEPFYKHNYSHTNMTGQPDFVKLAEAYGAEGYRVTSEDELESTLSAALASPKPAVIEVVVEPEENVYPMVPAGAALDEMLLV